MDLSACVKVNSLPRLAASIFLYELLSTIWAVQAFQLHSRFYDNTRNQYPYSQHYDDPQKNATYNYITTKANIVPC